MSSSRRPQRSGALAIAVALLAVAVPCLAAAPASAAKRAGKATVRVEISGLPKGERPSARLTGPRVRREVRRARVVFRGLRPGRYTLTLRNATLRGRGRRGAQAHPVKRRVSIVVRRRGSNRLAAAYGTVVAANTRRLPTRVLGFSGSPTSPSEIVVPAGGRWVVGGFLTAGPTRQFPQGLVSRITNVERRRRAVALGLENVPVTTVVPRHSGSLRISVPAGGAQTSAAAAGAQPGASAAAKRARVREYDLNADRNPIAFAASEAMGRIPCRIDGAAGSPFPLKPVVGFKLPAMEWDRYARRFHATAEVTVGMELQLAAGLGLSCGGTIGDYTSTFVAWLGPVPVPFFVGIGFPVGISFSKSDADFSGSVSQRHLIDVDTKRSNWVTDTVTPETRATGTLSATGTASIGLTGQIGLGLPSVANLRLEFGPSLEATIATSDWTRFTCETKATLSAGAVAEFLLFDETFDFPEATIFGPYQWESCATTEPIVGSWRSDSGQGDVRIEQAGEGAFQMIAVGDQVLSPSSRCVWLANGAARPIQGAMGSYAAPDEWMDSDDCSVVDSDPAGVLTILPVSRDRLRWCGRTRTRNGCVSYTRIRA